jgi:putative tryptophan/tyrosine transport system substrate-binding protein
MDRRVALTSLALVVHAAASAQTLPVRPYRLGLFPHMVQPFLSWLQEALAAVGWREGADYRLVGSGRAEGDEPPRAAIAQDMARHIDLFVASSSAYARAMQEGAPQVPIVMWTSGYPVEAGLAHSLAHPGKNLTGITAYASTGIWGKLLSLLREAKPGLSRVVVAWGYVPPSFPKEEIDPCWRELREAAGRLAMELQIVTVGGHPDRVTPALAEIEAAKPDGLLIMVGPAMFYSRHRFIDYALAARIPTAADWEWPPGAQPLLSYGANHRENLHQVAPYIVRILADRVPAGSLPIQQPARFELVIDRANARAIGLQLPRSLMLQAHRVTE